MTKVALPPLPVKALKQRLLPAVKVLPEMVIFGVVTGDEENIIFLPRSPVPVTLNVTLSTRNVSPVVAPVYSSSKFDLGPIDVAIISSALLIVIVFIFVMEEVEAKKTFVARFVATAVVAVHVPGPEKVIVSTVLIAASKRMLKQSAFPVTVNVLPTRVRRGFVAACVA